MKIDQRLHEGTIILSPRGMFFTEENVELMKQMIVDHLRLGNNRMILDLGGLDHLNSLGISILLYARKTMRRADGDLRLTSMSEDVRSVLHRTGLIGHFSESPSVDHALLELSRRMIPPHQTKSQQIGFQG